MKAMGDLLKFILILSVFLSIVNGGKLDGACPTGSHCLKLPILPKECDKDCEATAVAEKKADNVFSFVYQRSDVDPTSSVFLASGISKDSKMNEDLAVICFQNAGGPKIRTFRNNDHIPPTVVDPTPTDLFVGDPQQSVTDGILKCSFEIKFPIKFSGLDFPIDGPTFMLMSFGNTDKGNAGLPSYHGGNRVAGTVPIMGTVVPPPGTEGTGTGTGTGGMGTGTGGMGTGTGMGTGGMMEKIKQAFIGPCPTGMQCLKLSEDCGADKACKAQAVVEKKADNVFSFVYQRTDLGTTPVFLALGISKDSIMNDDLAVICFKDAAGTKIKTFRNNNHVPPTVVDPTPNGLFVGEPQHGVKDGILLCSFEIKFPIKFSGLEFPVGAPTFVLMSFGAANDAGDFPTYHGGNRVPGKQNIMDMAKVDPLGPEPTGNSTGATERVSIHQIWTCGVFVCIGLFIIPFIYVRQ